MNSATLMHVLYDDIADGSGTSKLSIRIGLLNNNSEPVGNVTDSQNSHFPMSTNSSNRK